MAAQVSLDYQTIWSPTQVARPRRVDNQPSSQSSMSQRKPETKSPEDGQDVGDVVLTTKEAHSPPQRLASGNEVIYISDDAASDMSDASDDDATDETLPSVQAIMQSVVEEGRTMGSTSGGRELMRNCDDQHDGTYRSASSTPPEYKQIRQSPRPSFGNPAANYLTGVSSLTPRTCASTPTSTSATSRTNSPSLESRPVNAASTQTSCSSMSAGDVATEKPDIRPLTCTYSPDETHDDLDTQRSSCDKNTSANSPVPHTHRRPPGKRRRGASPSHGLKQSSPEGPSVALDDTEYCPSTDHETEGESDDQSNVEDRPSRKRRKFRTMSSRSESLSKGSLRCVSTDFEVPSDMGSPAVRERVNSLADSTDAAFDEWVLQDVILKRTIMNGKATFQFQFEWDMCMKHGEEMGKSRKGTIRQTNDSVPVKAITRRPFTPEEDRFLVELKEMKVLPWSEIHRRFCGRFTQRSKDTLQVRYCTKLKRRDQ